MAFWDRLEKRAVALQAVAAVITMLLAMAALFGVKLQIDASARLQREQSARDIYREFVNLSISKPEFSAPNYCAIRGTPQEPAYADYVEYLLYASEQMLAATPEWKSAIEGRLEDHRVHLCQIEDWTGYTDDVQALMTSFRTTHCKDALPECAKGSEPVKAALP